jgi:hypothetical protein
MFEYFSRKFSTPGRLFRLNYAIDMRYGVLHDIASKIPRASRSTCASAMSISSGRPMPRRRALRCLAHCDTPTSPINVSGHEILSVRDLAAKLGARLGREPIIVGTEEPTAWLTDTKATKLFGLPIVDTAQLIAWTADWGARDAEFGQTNQIRGARWPILITSPSISLVRTTRPRGWSCPPKPTGTRTRPTGGFS